MASRGVCTSRRAAHCRNCERLSTWSSCRPLGKASSSVKKTSCQGGLARQQDLTGLDPGTGRLQTSELVALRHDAEGIGKARCHAGAQVLHQIEAEPGLLGRQREESPNKIITIRVYGRPPFGRPWTLAGAGAVQTIPAGPTRSASRRPCRRARTPSKPQSPLVCLRVPFAPAGRTCMHGFPAGSPSIVTCRPAFRGRRNRRS